MTETEREGERPTRTTTTGGAAGQAEQGGKTGQRRRRRPARRPPERVREPYDDRRHRSGMQLQGAPQYLVIGHICADLQPDGTAVLGGTALYSALTAARLGWRVGVLTRGVYGRTVNGVAIPSLDAYAEDISIIVQEADRTTTFLNEYQADRRVQTIQRWAGPIDLRGLPPHWRNAKVIHLGPIADEIDPRQTGGLTPQFFGATPQGWMREWPRRAGGRVTHIPLRLPGELIGRLDSIVVSLEEITYTREIVERIGARRLSVVTKDVEGARIIYGTQTAELPGFPIRVKDATGAGDVFAAAFFIKASDRTASARTAGRFANAVAALSLREIGPAGVPSLDEVEALLDE
jgi:sugar/nucleoside kinase (ribokinase family)